MFQLAIIGHRKFYAETVAGISNDDLKKYVRFVCVNENLPKDIPSEFPNECITKEWEIPEYEPFYQREKYYQNSVFFNTMNVIESLGLDQIGFAQYDMIFTPEIFDEIKETCEADKNAAIGFYPYPIERMFDIIAPQAWQFIIQQYAKFFQAPVDEIEKLEKMPLALFHTFVIPKATYCRLMHFTKKVLPNIVTFLQNDTRHMAGTLERLFALFLNLEIITNNMKDFRWIKNLQHDDTGLRMRDDFRGLPGV